MQWLFYVLLVCCSVAIAIRMIADHGVRRLFGLSMVWRVVATDLGRIKRPLYLRGERLCGSPDAVFRHWFNGAMICGELKSRQRGNPLPRELFQVTLYCGLIQHRYRRPCSGLLRYPNRTVAVPFCRRTYDWLLSQRDACSAARRAAGR